MGEESKRTNHFQHTASHNTKRNLLKSKMEFKLILILAFVYLGLGAPHEETSKNQEVNMEEKFKQIQQNANANAELRSELQEMKQSMMEIKRHRRAADADIIKDMKQLIREELYAYNGTAAFSSCLMGTEAHKMQK